MLPKIVAKMQMIMKNAIVTDCHVSKGGRTGVVGSVALLNKVPVSSGGANGYVLL